MKRFLLIFSVAVFLGLPMGSYAQEKPGAEAQAAASRQAGIAWFGTLKSALVEAARTGKPILLISAAPHCHNISGIW